MSRNVLSWLLSLTAGAALYGQAPVLTSLYQFSDSSGGYFPYAGVTIAPGGVLYGTTTYGGAYGWGTVYSVTPPSTAGGPWTYNTIWDFQNTTDGGMPYAGVLLGPGGVLYGDAYSGGTGVNCLLGQITGCGTVYQLTPNSGYAWTETTLHNFTGQGSGDGAYPTANMTLGPGGVLYGSVGYGINNNGQIFSLTPPATSGGAWTEATLYRFPGGSAGRYPVSPLVLEKGANGHFIFFGTLNGGGANNTGGVYALAPPAATGGVWTEKLLYSFPAWSAKATAQISSLALGSGGVLYGTFWYSGTSYDGMVFSLAPPATAGGPWTPTTLYTFKGAPDGFGPASVVPGPGGVLYGTTDYGGNGPVGYGTIFKLSPPATSGGAWTESIIYNFAGPDGAYPNTITFARNGLLYGTTFGGGIMGGCGGGGCGTVFSLKP